VEAYVKDLLNLNGILSFNSHLDPIGKAIHVLIVQFALLFDNILVPLV